MKILFAILLLSCSALGGTNVVLAWDANAAADQVVEYVLYERVSGKDVERGRTAIPTITLTNVEPGQRTYVVKARNLWGESGPSNTVSLPPAPSDPKTLRVIVEVRVEQ